MNLQIPKPPDQTKEIEKPPFLYHGSPNGDIKEFEPRISSGSGEQFGPLVYAMSDIPTASIFMIKTNDWSTGFMGDRPYVVFSEPLEEVMENDKGGYLYSIPSKTFTQGSTLGMGGTEWSSKEKVKPIKKEFFPSALNRVIELDIALYFIGRENWEKFIKLKNKEKVIFINQFKTENERRKSQLQNK